MGLEDQKHKQLGVTTKSARGTYADRRKESQGHRDKTVSGG